jgi:conjugal transfer pilus assembly protein TraW
VVKSRPFPLAAVVIAALIAAGQVLADPPASPSVGPQDVVPPPALFAKGKQLAQDPAFDQAALNLRMQQQLHTGVPQAIVQQGSQVGISALRSLGAQAGLNAKISTSEDSARTAHYALFVSQSMGPQGLRDVIDMAKAHPDVVVMFRGINPGQKLADLLLLLHGAGLEKDGPLPNIQLDPVSFRDHQIIAVPTLEKLDADGHAIAGVRGVINPTWLDEKMIGGRRGDLGKWGSVFPISEIDLIQAMQAAAAKIDIKGSAQRGYEQYWSRQGELNLPIARVDRTHLWDPSVTVNDGITAPDGPVIAYPGQRLNPMDVMPFTRKVFVFDARDPRQVAVAQRVIAQYHGDPNLVLCTVGDQDWTSFQSHSEVLQARLFQASSAMVQRLGIQALPSLVTAGPDKQLLIREFALTTVASAKHVPIPETTHADPQSSRR